MGIKSIALVVSTLVLSTSVNAAIISADWQSAGDNMITVDTVSGLEWLDLTATQNLSYNDVVAQLGEGGAYEGWSYGSAGLVSSFFAEFGGAGTYSGASPAHNAVFSNGLLTHWGVLGTNSVRDISNFIMADGNIRLGRHDYGQARDFYDPERDDHLYLPLNDQPDGVANAIFGSALYRESPPSVVPVPVAAWLFGSGLLGLIGVARRKVCS